MTLHDIPVFKNFQLLLIFSKCPKFEISQLKLILRIVMCLELVLGVHVTHDVLTPGCTFSEVFTNRGRP